MCVACPEVGQAEAGVPALWGKGGDLLRECGGARAFLSTRNHFSWILSVRSLPYSAGSPVRVARANGPLEPTATYLVAVSAGVGSSSMQSAAGRVAGAPQKHLGLVD